MSSLLTFFSSMDFLELVGLQLFPEMVLIEKFAGS